LFFSELISAQCAMCKAVVESGDAEIAEGLKYWHYLFNGFSIYFSWCCWLFFIQKMKKK